MKWLPIGLLALSSAVFAQEAPSNKVRTFRASLGTTGVPHAVHFDARAEQLVVCANGEASLCQSWKFRADDVLPYSTPSGESNLLVIDSPFAVRTCRIGQSAGRPSVQCSPLSMSALIGDRLVTQPVALILNAGQDDEYQCGYRYVEGLLCSSAQHLQPQGALVFGRFTGDKLQALSVDQGKVCNVGGSCRTTQGLDLLAKTEAITVAGRTSKRIDRAALLGLAEFTRTACVAFFESETRVGFTCEQEVAGSAGPTARAVTVHGGGPAALDVMRHGTEAPSTMRALLQRAHKNAGGPMTLKNFKAGRYVADEEGFVKTLGDKYYYDPDLPSEGDFGPSSYDGWFNNGYRGRFWSDAWGINLRWDQEEDRTKCLQVCDSNKTGEDSWCDIGSTVVFAGFAGGTIAVMVAFPAAAGATFLTGAAVTSLAAGGALTMCRGWTGAKNVECRSKC